MPTTFTTKVNKRVPGNELTITGESHTVSLSSPYQIKLIEVPLQEDPSTVTISGYTETTNSTPSSGQFHAKYTTGYITFHSSAAGNIVSVNYKGRGSIVDSTDVNSLQTAVDTVQTEVETARGSLGDLDTRLDVSLANNGTLNSGVVVPSTISTNSGDSFTFPGKVTINGGLKLRLLSSLEEASYVSTLVLGDRGTIWFNGTDSQFKGWNGTTVVILG